MTAAGQETINITLADGSQRQVTNGCTGAELAKNISRSLGKKALAIEVDGKLFDLSYALSQNASVRIITREDDEALELIRHDAAHVMAEAVQSLFPGTEVTIGPVIADGFYYDFATKKPFTEDDLVKIEAKMRGIIQQQQEFVREVWPRNEAIAYFEQHGEKYKAEIIRDLPENEEVSIYRQGDWLDLCRGPHLPNTKHIGLAFKLMKVAGAYWRGDANNAMLTRIYGTAWRSEEELKAYLNRLEEAERRDHRKLARAMDLFHFQEEAPGAVFWHPKGWTLFQDLINYMRRRQEAADYVEINTPDIMDKGLWEASGHWEKFGENMFVTEAKENRVYALKPMNCPGGIQVYNHGLKSYRDLPLKIAEFGKVHRYEPSGALHGLMRVRAFTQDDAHIFCTQEQMSHECEIVCDLILSIYRDFGFDDVRIKFSDRPEKRIGSDDIWDKAESALREAIDATGLDYSYNPGEGAFYGPKIEFVLRDAIGRDWQCGTLQVDLNLPERLNTVYIAEDGKKHRPVMLHRALFGSLERFTGILLEHHAGHMPLWLSPLQIVVATVITDAKDYAEDVVKACREAGLRVELDIRNEKISYKIREHSNAKVPVLMVVGKREAEEQKVAIRRLGSKNNTIMSLKEAVLALQQEALSPLDRADELNSTNEGR